VAIAQAQNRAVYSFHDEDAVRAADLMEKAVYGLPELNGGQLPGAALVRIPAAMPLGDSCVGPAAGRGHRGSRKGIISDSKSGVSGAGKEATARTHFVSVADNLSAYSYSATAMWERCSSS